MLLTRFPRQRFCHAPTPLEPLPRLSQALGGPTILVKRDDATGLALGGNKNRKLEYLLGEAQAAGADTLITAGGIQSNHCRQTAAAAAKHGLKCHLVLMRRVVWNHPDYERTGNVLLDRLFGATLHTVSRDADPDAEMEQVAEAVRTAGGNPFVIPVGGSTPVGALGYVGVALELLEQANERGHGIDAVIHCTGSGGTQAGLIVGFEASSSGVPVIGISVSHTKAELVGMITPLIEATAAKVGARIPDIASTLHLHDEYIGADYGLPTPGMLEALTLCGALEGLVLDPVYTGKAMAGLIDLIRRGRFGRDDTVVFIHTGGVPALFAYENAIHHD